MDEVIKPKKLKGRSNESIPLKTHLRSYKGHDERRKKWFSRRVRKGSRSRVVGMLKSASFDWNKR